MCGIVGYLGSSNSSNDALEVIISGLEKLEYRGYDSAGVALLNKDGLFVSRAQGKLSQLKNQLSQNPPKSSKIGIGHTRWATHGKPSETNAHPHSSGRVSLIHNGIIENYAQLKAQMIQAGRSFKSETDTEVVAHLLDCELQSGLAPFEALKSCCKKIRGAYAFVAFDSASPDRLLIAKNATPIVIGLAEGEVFIASDIPAFLAHTRSVVVLEDGDIAELTVDGIRIENNGNVVKREAIHITWDAVTAQKGGFKHFMLKEIHEQPQALADTLRTHLSDGAADGLISLSELDFSTADLKQIERIVIVACGTAWHAGLVSKFYIESLAKIPCEVDYASEFRYRTPVLDQKTLVLAISQSGETADTLAAIEMAKSKAKTLAICNVLGSSLTRKVKNVLFTHAGPEISVASTKAFTTQLVAAYILALWLAEKRNTLTRDDVARRVAELRRLPLAVEQALALENQVKDLAKNFYNARDFLYLGRGLHFPVALEGALKLKELSYIHAEGYPAGEMKHGPIALIDENMPVVVLLPRSAELYEKSVSNLREVESRGGKIIVLSDSEHASELDNFAKARLDIPFVSEELSPIVMSIPLQFLAYYIAVMNGTDVDQPRNLAKSVTVE